jgi:hypothetical protein
MTNQDLHSPPDGVAWVELKVTLGGTQIDDGLRTFDLDPDDAERREIFFCERVDTPSNSIVLPLLARGIILRIRQITDSPDDSTLKLRAGGLRGPNALAGADPSLRRRRQDRG